MDFVRIQVERDEIVAQFPRVEDRSEEVKKRLKSLKNNVMKKQKTLWSADKLTLKKTAITDGDRKVEQRSKQDQEAKDREREENRKSKATEAAKAKERNATEEAKDKESGKQQKSPSPRQERGMPQKKHWPKQD